MPLPSNPEISKGEPQSFSKISDLVNLYFDLTVNRYRFRTYEPRQSSGDGERPEGITITFQQTIGFHFLTVVKADHSNDLMSWLNDFLESRGYSAELPSDFDELFGRYIKDRINFFVIDMMKAGPAIHTMETLIYEFTSLNLYYPLRISSIFSGSTSVSLFTLTSKEIHGDSVLGGKFMKKAQFQITKEALPKISANITELFSDDPHLCYFIFFGLQSSFNNDILGEFETGVSMPALTIATLNIGMGIALLFLFVPSKTSFTPRLSKSSILRIGQWAALSSGLIGTVLIWIALALPWGVKAIGENGELLIPLNGAYATSQSSATIGFIYLILLLAAVPCCVYLLLMKGDSKRTATIFASIGVLAACSAVLSTMSMFKTISIGLPATLTGCSFIILASLLSRWRVKMGPVDHSEITYFKSYVIKRFAFFVLTLVVITLFGFWLYSYFSRYIWPWIF